MKRMKQIIAILLAFVLLMTSAGLADGLAAMAEDYALSRQNDDAGVVQATDETAVRRMSNDWEYYINPGGYVTVSGYDNAAATSLTIPNEIDGLPVVAIEDKAFADLTVLNSIKIPISVSYIGPYAFANPSYVTVHSYHGSYALAYAAARGMRSVNRSTFDFKDGVVDLTPVEKYVGGGGGRITLRAVDASQMKAGSCFYVPGNDRYGMNVIVGVVESRSYQGDTAYITYTEGNIFTAVKQLDISSVGNVKAEVTSVGEGVRYEGQIGAALDLLEVNKKAEKNFSTKPFSFNWSKGAFTASGSVTFDINFFMETNVAAGVGWSGFYVDMNKFNIHLDFTPTYKIEVTGKYSTGEKKLGSVTIYSVGVFAVTADLYASFDAKGTIRFELKQQYNLDMKWKSSKKSFDNSCTASTLKKELSLEANIDAKLIPKVNVELVGVKVLTLGVTFHLDLDAKLVVRTFSPIHTCADVSLILHISLNVKFGILSKVAGYKKTLLDKTFKLPDVSLIRAQHFEDWKEVSGNKCTRGAKTVTFNTGNGTDITPVTAAWGTSIIVSNPTLKNHTFGGWFTDAKCTKPWNMTAPITTNMTVYAKWIPKKTPPAPATPKPTVKPTAKPTVKPEVTAVATPKPGSTATPMPTAKPTPTPTPTPVPVKSMSLNKTKAELYTDVAEESVQLTVTVLPDDAEDKSVYWSSSDPNVAYVDQDGLVTAYSAGTAVITCQSYSNPSVTATCEVTVKQRVEWINFDAYKLDMVCGDKKTITTDIIPDDATNKAVIWSSNDEKIATVDQNGVVTAVAKGSAEITAAAKDGFGATQKCIVNVENMLEVQSAVVNDVFFAGAASAGRIGYADVTRNALLRMHNLGNKIEWSLSRKGDGVSEVALVPYDTTTTVNGTEISSTSLMLDLVSANGNGTDVYTVICTSGEYTASAEFTVMIVGDEYADAVTLPVTTFYVNENETAIVPAVPTSAVSGKEVPEGLSLELAGDTMFGKFAVTEATDDGVAVTFADSGLYTAVARYTLSNLTYEVPLTFYVADENGLIHLPVTNVSLSEPYYVLVEGESVTLETSVLPKDAWNQDIVWTVDNAEVAKIDENGVLTGLCAGSTYIIGEAADGSEAQCSAFVTVESVLQLTDSELEITVYEDGSVGGFVDGVSLTDDSALRMLKNGMAASWTLERVSGDATVIALEEMEAAANGVSMVSGVQLNLLRMNHAGTDEYRIRCKTGAGEKTCSVVVNVLESGLLPGSITLDKTEYTVGWGEKLNLNTTPVSTPELSADYNVFVEAPHGFWNAVATEDRGEGFIEYTFSGSGIYDLEVVFEGSNYSYSVPVSVTLLNENNQAPVMVESIEMSEDVLYLMAGEEAKLTAQVLPANADDQALAWSSFDSSIAYVSTAGVVTAVSAGRTAILCTNAASGVVGLCMVEVEDGLTLDKDAVETTVYLGGNTRTAVESVSLTAASSSRQSSSPEWTIKRVSGNNLTLRVADTVGYDVDGNEVYTAEISLYSVSRTGDTVYELTCKTDEGSVTVPVTVHAVHAEDAAPAAIVLSQTEYCAEADELIIFNPEVACLPDGRELPNGVRVSFNGDAQFVEALNAEDYFVSQSISTLSFAEPGLYEADCVYEWSNISYTIPVTFRISDADGNVPVHGKKFALDAKALWLTPGETTELNAVFTPADLTNSGIAWTSSNEKIVRVDQNGVVTAVALGQAYVIATPEDSHLKPIQLPVTVENTFTIETGAEEITLYLQGKQRNSLSAAYLSEGSAQRLKKAGITPEWTLKRTGGANTELVTTVSDDGSTFFVDTASLLTGGTDTYVVSCTAGDALSWEQSYSIRIIDLGDSIAQSVAPTNSHVDLKVGEAAVIDFAPVCTPAGTSLPEEMVDYYVGLGNFYDALDYEVYEENGDKVSVAFAEAGRYLLTRQYFLSNLRFTSVCVIDVGEAETTGLLSVTNADAIVYKNGWSGVVATADFTDGMVDELWSDDIDWMLERVSGNSTVAALRKNGASADLFIADADREGTDVYRISAAFGGVTESVEVTVEVIEPEDGTPERITLAKDTFEGMIGNTIVVPIGVMCEPLGTFLPDSADEFWSFEMNGQGADVATSTIKDGLLRVEFLQSGYYSGTLTYESGNLNWKLPVYFTVCDEENVVSKPDMKLRMANGMDTVYLAGSVNLPVGKLILGESANVSAAGTANAYINAHSAEWSIETTGNAALLEMRQTSLSTAEIVLKALNKAGEVGYRVTCKVGEDAYVYEGALNVVADTAVPDATLARCTYYAVTGNPVVIDRKLYSRNTGELLQGTTEWNADSILSVIGYDYEETEDSWTATFYREGTHTSSVSVQTANTAYELPLTVVVTSNGNAEKTVLCFPAALTVIESEAMTGVNASCADLRGTKIHTIESGAFRNCIDLESIYLPDSVTDIADDAFYGCLNLTVHCSKGSYAESYALSKGISVVCE